MKFMGLLFTFFLIVSFQVRAEETALEGCLKSNKAHPDLCTQSERFHIDTLAQLEAAWKKVYPNKPMPNNLVFPKESQAAKEYAAYLEKQNAKKQKKSSVALDADDTARGADDNRHKTDDTPAEKHVGIPGKILPQDGDNDHPKKPKAKAVQTPVKHKKSARQEREERIRLGIGTQKDLDDHERDLKRAADRASKKEAEKSEHKAERTKPKLPKVVQHKHEGKMEHESTPDANKGLQAKCESFEGELSAKYESNKVKTPAQLIEEKNKLIRASLEEFEFRDFSKMKAELSKDDPKQTNAKIRLLEWLQKFHDLDKNEVVITALKVCRDDKCKIEAYNSQLRYIRSQITAELERSKFLTGMPTDKEHPFFITNAKEMLFNASSEIPVPNSKKSAQEAIDSNNAFVSSLQKWNGDGKNNEGVSQKACCHSADSFWCSKEGAEVAKSALTNTGKAQKADDSKKSEKAAQ